MGAMKRLADEYRRAGWNLSGFAAEERAAWRRLLPEHLAAPRLVPADIDIEPVSSKPRRLSLVEAVETSPPMSPVDPPFDPTPKPSLYSPDPSPRKPPATTQPDLF